MTLGGPRGTEALGDSMSRHLDGIYAGRLVRECLQVITLDILLGYTSQSKGYHTLYRL